jgi:hypothetical protein
MEFQTIGTDDLRIAACIVENAAELWKASFAEEARSAANPCKIGTSWHSAPKQRTPSELGRTVENFCVLAPKSAENLEIVKAVLI